MTHDRDIARYLEYGECPDCRRKMFRFGPRGGAAQNVECTGCRSRFNVTVADGSLVFAQRIDSTAKWPGPVQIGPLLAQR